MERKTAFLNVMISMTMQILENGKHTQYTRYKYTESFMQWQNGALYLISTFLMTPDI